MKTLLSGGVIVTCDEQHTIHAPGDLVLDGDSITFVGARYDGEYDVRLPAVGQLLMPGMINAHTHSGMSIFRSLADDVDLTVFLDERAWPREVTLTPDDVYAGSLLSAVEMLKSGITTYVDMYFFEEALGRAALDAGGRSVITATVLDVPMWEPILGSWERQLERSVDFCRRWEGREGRIHTGLGPHAPYTVSLEALKAISLEAQTLQLPVNIHLVETQWERETFNARGLGSTVHALEDIGFFEASVLAAHSIWVEDGDLDIYRDRRVGIAHCPQSNAKLGAGVAPIASMLAHQINVGLGTDSASTNNNLDLWEEMRLAPLLAKVSALDPKPVPAPQALWMATRMGACAIHQSRLGVLAEGYLADIVVLDLDDTTTVPVFGPDTYISHLVNSVGRELVHSVWVNGERVVSAGEVQTVDEEHVRRSAQESAIAVSRRAGQ